MPEGYAEDVRYGEIYRQLTHLQDLEFRQKFCWDLARKPTGLVIMRTETQVLQTWMLLPECHRMA